MRILTVEDDPGARTIIERVLSRALDARVDTAERVDQALEQVDARRYDVVLLDHELPDGTGLEVLAAIRRSSQHPAVVYLTGRGDEAVARRALSEGAVDYRAKSVETYRGLADIVRQAHSTWGGVEQLVCPPPREQADATAPMGDRRALFRDLVARTELDALLVHDGAGRQLLSTLAPDMPVDQLAARAAAWGHQARELAATIGTHPEGALGLVRGPTRTIAAMSAPDRACLVGLFGPDVEPGDALRDLKAAGRLVQDALSADP